MKTPFLFFIHDLNPWGGQDRSIIEIAKRISHLREVIIISFTLNDPGYPHEWGDVRWIKVSPNLRRPVLLKMLYYIGVTVFFQFTGRYFGKSGRARSMSTGISSISSDLVQIQFVQTTWNQHIGKVKVPTSFISGIYRRALLNFNLMLEKFCYRSGKNYVAISRTVQKELEDAFGLKSNVHIIHHGVDSRHFRPTGNDKVLQGERAQLRGKYGFSENDKVAVFVGAYERKNLLLCIEALSKLPSSSPMKILAVGSGNRAFYEGVIKNRKLEDRVILVPHEKQIAPFYRAGDFFILPSLYEAFGLVILEAMACGLAPIVSKTAGAAELVEDGKSGFLISDPTSSDEVTSLLTKFLKDPDLAFQMGAQAREVACARSWDQVAREYDALFSKLYDSQV